MNIQTKDLIIRKMKPSDAQDFFQYRSLPEVCALQWYSPYDMSKCEEFCKEQEQKHFPVSWQWIQFGIELRSEGKLIGDIWLCTQSYDDRIVELGITLNPEYQKKWYAKQALLALFQTLFTDYKIHRIVAITSQENTPSIKLLENVGMMREGTTRQSFWNKGKRHDEFLYAILKEDIKHEISG